MRRIHRTLLLFSLAVLLFWGSAGAQEAEEITARCAFTKQDSGKLAIRSMTDRDYKTYAIVRKGGSLIVDGKGEEIGSVFLQYYDRTTSGDVYADTGDGEWLLVSDAGHYLSEWIPMPEGTCRVRVHNTSKARLFLAEITVYGTGDQPANGASWEECDKADILHIVCHPDDELLWFGGFLPTYAGERGLKVQVVYAVPSVPERRLELLDGLWHCGVRYYPCFLNMHDTYSKTLKQAYKKWSQNNLQKKITGMIRRFRPEVVVTQDLNGEYGHGGHRAVADSTVKSIRYAAESAKWPDQVAEYGIWQAKKLYIHLYGDDPLRLDWHQPLEAFGGKDGMTVAIEAMNCHRSQVAHGWAIEEGGACDNTLFGLYFTTVGPDEARNDLMEHIETEESTDD